MPAALQMEGAVLVARAGYRLTEVFFERDEAR
jgi:hypothetical protein